MQLKFLAVTMPKYIGSNGSGEVVTLEQGQSCAFAKGSAEVLLRKYPKDFAIDVAVKEEKEAEFAPSSDKQYKKQTNYKGK